ncbi:MAG TPA: nucleotidyltransferase family protein [Burkholderiaceae bacterium]|nr:nucleotidyltransferase family protein [Burkholderiaceae bacterium]
MVKALILAAGRGERLRPLTDKQPKPMLEVHGIPMMQWAMRALGMGGFTNLVVNTAWLGQQIENHYSTHFVDHFGPESAYLLPSVLLNSEQHSRKSCAYNIQYSHEGIDFGGALETAGGIVRALPLLCSPQEGDIFWVLAGDVFAPNFPFSQDSIDRFKASNKLAHLWLVPNPQHNALGDFGLQEDGLVLNEAGSNGQKYTFSTVALYRQSFFSSPYCDIAEGNPTGINEALAPLLRKAIDDKQVSAELYTDTWVDVGTPERLKQLNNQTLYDSI